MPQLSRVRGKVGYVDDGGVHYFLFEEVGISGQAKLGEVALAGTETHLPIGIKPRYTTVRDATNKISRKLTVFSPGAPIQTAGTTINLNETVAGALTGTPFVASGEFQGERRPRANARP